MFWAILTIACLLFLAIECLSYAVALLFLLPSIFRLILQAGKLVLLFFSTIFSPQTWRRARLLASARPKLARKP